MKKFKDRYVLAEGYPWAMRKLMQHKHSLFANSEYENMDKSC